MCWMEWSNETYTNLGKPSRCLEHGQRRFESVLPEVPPDRTECGQLLRPELVAAVPLLLTALKKMLALGEKAF